MDDSIVEDIHQARAEHAEAFDHDLQAIFADVRQKQHVSERGVVSFPAKRLSDEESAKTETKAPALQE